MEDHRPQQIEERNSGKKKNTRNKETLLFVLWLLKIAALELERALPTPQILPSY